MIHTITLYVYKNNSWSDCTNGGISSRYNTIYVVVDKENSTDSFDEDNLPENLFVINEITIGDNSYKRLEPFNKNGKWFMAGGNYAHSCDSRWSEYSQYPLAIHDRTE